MLSSIGLLALDQGCFDRTSEVFTESLVTARKSGQHWIMGMLLEAMAGVAAGQGCAERAARLFGAAEALRAAIGTPRWPALLSLSNRGVVTARTAVEPKLFVGAWKRGRAMSLEEAVAFALGESE